MNTLNVTVKETTIKGTAGFNGVVAIQGLKPTKLARKDGETLFATTSSLKTVARSTAKRLGMEVTYTEPVKKAAKKSIKTTCSKGSCSKSSCCKSKGKKSATKSKKNTCKAKK